MRSKGVYVNTLNVEASSGLVGRKTVVVAAPIGFALLAGFQLGLDSEFCDEPGVRVSVQLQVGPEGCADDPPRDPPVTITEVIGQFLFRGSPGRALQGPPTLLPAPYEFEPGECLWLFLKLTNDTGCQEPVGQDCIPLITARANVFAWFVSEEGIVIR
jgi:hypothetical protein